MNIITLTGNSVKDIELKFNQSGNAIGTGTIAVRRDYKNKKTGEYDTDFIDFVTVGKQAEIMADNIRKGDKFGLFGSLQKRVWEKDDGSKVYFAEVFVKGFDFPNKPKNANHTSQNGGQSANHGSQDPFANGTPISISDDMLPF
jgi:single-strand DNA-binding protein